jgi:hypothetical protein
LGVARRTKAIQSRKSSQPNQRIEYLAHSLIPVPKKQRAINTALITTIASRRPGGSLWFGAGQEATTLAGTFNMMEHFHVMD